MNGKRFAVGATVVLLIAGGVVACSDENACAKGTPAPAPRAPAPKAPSMTKPQAPKPAASKAVKPPKTKSVPDGHGGTTIVVVHDDEDCDDD